MAGIAVTSFMPILSDLGRGQCYRRLEGHQAELLGEMRRDILRHCRDAVGSRRDNRGGNEARDAKQDTLRRDLGLERVLNQAMRSMPDIRRRDHDMMSGTKAC